MKDIGSSMWISYILLIKKLDHHVAIELLCTTLYLEIITSGKTKHNYNKKLPFFFWRSPQLIRHNIFFINNTKGQKCYMAWWVWWVWVVGEARGGRGLMSWSSNIRHIASGNVRGSATIRVWSGYGGHEMKEKMVLAWQTIKELAWSIMPWSLSQIVFVLPSIQIITTAIIKFSSMGLYLVITLIFGVNLRKKIQNKF